MDKNTSTFINFISDHTIQIPLIQRDYVQGIAFDDKTTEKRDEFVKKLLNAILPDGKPYTLDFIYGARESFGTSVTDPNAPFLPLDGQQRLTTLLLMHWILAVKTNTDGKYNWVFELLKKFSYKTRISSDKFCRKIFSTQWEKDRNLCNQIADKTWLTEDLKADPTLKAMLEMTNLMENTLSAAPYNDKLEQMAELLFNKNESRISFSILDMDKYHLTDGLYVKMNARGKELTPFENWKADFIGLISTDELAKNRFTKGIEHEWNDVFWADVYAEYVEQVENATDSEKKRVKYPRIDEHFMNFFSNMSRIFYFLYTEDSKPNADDFKTKKWSTTENLYGSNQEARDRLFSLLDCLSRINQESSISQFFTSLFHTHGSTPWDTHNQCVRLFENNEDKTNLFKVACESDDFKWYHILLYAILEYCIKYNIHTVTSELKLYTRLCRDYLYQQNYLDSGKVVVTPQIRIVDIKTFESVFSYFRSAYSPLDSLETEYNASDAKYVQIEKDKLPYYLCSRKDVCNLFLKIEDMGYTHGNTKAFTNLLDNCIKDNYTCNEVWEAIYAFIHATVTEKVQLFLALNYKGIKIGNDCAYGKRIFIGGGNGNKAPRWEVHFRKNEAETSNWLTSYVEAFIKLKDIQAIIKEERNKIESHPTTLRDYMLKYEDVMAAQTYWRTNKEDAPFYYAMPNPWKDMDVIVIHSFSDRPLGNSYQTCPMTNAVARLMKHYDSNHMGYSGVGSKKAGLMIHNGDWSNVYFTLNFKQHEWSVPAKDYELLSPELQTRLSAEVNTKGETVSYTLLPEENKDLIENACDFIDEVFLHIKKQGLI